MYMYDVSMFFLKIDCTKHNRRNFEFIETRNVSQSIEPRIVNIIAFGEETIAKSHVAFEINTASERCKFMRTDIQKDCFDNK